MTASLNAPRGQALFPGDGISPRDPRVPGLQRHMVDEIFRTLGFNPEGSLRRLAGGLFARPTRRLARMALEIDDQIGRSSLPVAFAELLSLFSHPPQIEGLDHIPSEGPLLIAPNHPGTIDSVAIMSVLPRKDIKVIAGYTPILESLPHLAEHLTFRGLDTGSKVAVVRVALRHLKEGGCLVIFPAGRLEPDPAVLPGAADSLPSWHRSIELFLKHVPQSALAPVIVSHILLPRFVQHPVARLRRTAANQQRTAEMLQIMAQILRRQRYMLTPRISFGPVTSLTALTAQAGDGSPFDLLLTHFEQLLHQHVAGFDHDYPPLSLDPA